MLMSLFENRSCEKRTAGFVETPDHFPLALGHLLDRLGGV